jgi:LytS/YehU family sensor histidine kinase
MRFRRRLAVSYDVYAELLEAKVPHFSLQPLVENAIRHGLASRSRGGSIVVSASRRDDTLRLDVEDDGLGVRANPARRSRPGLGLASTRARLAQLHGDNWRLDLRPRDGGGTIASITMPFVAARAEDGETGAS